MCSVCIKICGDCFFVCSNSNLPFFIVVEYKVGDIGSIRLVYFPKKDGKTYRKNLARYELKL